MRERFAKGTAPLEHAPHLHQLPAAQLAAFVGILQGGLDGLLVACSAMVMATLTEPFRPRRRPASALAFLEEQRDALDVVEAQARLLGDDALVVAQLLNF